MSGKTKAISEMLGIKYPVIVAPMFLVSSPEMVIEAIRNGCTAAIPSLNFRSADELRNGIRKIKSAVSGPMGINLIVNKSNFRLKSDLDVCIEEGVDFYITSLGNPAEVIEAAHAKGKLVFCDVVNSEQAKKVESAGADAVIAVNNRAGGHAGSKSMKELIASLRSVIGIPIISAGGVSTYGDLENALREGASGVSVGTIFIASNESPVSREYKEAVVRYGEKDIVMTTRLSGTPCTVINTPYVQKVGLEAGWLENIMKKNKKLKKFIKTILFIRGMKKLRDSAFGFSYKDVWCAGPSLENVHAVRPMKSIIGDLVSGLQHG